MQNIRITDGTIGLGKIQPCHIEGMDALLEKIKKLEKMVNELYYPMEKFE